jgi:hypothetical protein
MSRTLGQSDVAWGQLRSARLEELGEFVLVGVQAAIWERLSRRVRVPSWDDPGNTFPRMTCPYRTRRGGAILKKLTRPVVYGCCEGRGFK